jgi:WD40 repeat protein
MGAPAIAPAFDLFVDYADEDESWVRGWLLPELNLPQERSVTKRQFDLGATLPAEFERAVTRSRYTALVLSRAYLRDEWTRFGELLASFVAVESGAEKVIPILLEDCELPLRVQFRVRLDCREKSTRTAEIKRLRELLQLEDPKPEVIPCPYPGIVPFARENARFFFGREREIEALANRVGKQSLLLVVGPSGSGKSSLVFSGLLPKLEQQSAYWLIRSMRPGSHPVDRLTSELKNTGEQAGDWQSAVRKLLEASAGAGRLLLVIDQFEEAFSQAPPGQLSQFGAALQQIAAHPSCAVLLVLRADFYDPFLSSNIVPFDAETQQFTLSRPGDAELRATVVEPAEAVGVKIKKELVERLLADGAGEPGILPMLQETMRLLWEKRENRLIEIDAYLSFDEKQSGLWVALSLQGNAALSGMKDPERRIARRVLLRLVQFGEGRDDTRRQQRLRALGSKDDDPAKFAATIDRLVDFRILTKDKDRNNQVLVDLAHEALIRGWPLLSDLVRDRRQAELTRRRLLAKAEEWERLARKGGFLDRLGLAEAREWQSGSAAQDVGIDPAVEELIDASAAKLQRDRRVRMTAIATIVALIAGGAAVILRSRFTSRLDAIEAIRESNPAAALQQAIDAVNHAHWFGPDLSARAQSALQDAIQSAEPNGNLSLGAEIDAVALRKDGELVAAAGRGGKVRLRDLVSDRETNLDLVDAPQDLSAIQIAPEAGSIWAAGMSGEVFVWDSPDDGQERTAFRVPSQVTALAVSTDGHSIAAGRQDGYVTIFDARTKEERTWQAHKLRINRLVYSGDGAHLAAGSADGTATLWGSASGRLEHSLPRDESEVTGVSFDETGRILATASSKGNVRTWDVETGRSRAPDAKVCPNLTDLTFLRIHVLAIACGPQAVIFDLEAKKITATLHGHTGDLQALSSAGAAQQVLATASLDTHVRIYYLNSELALKFARDLLQIWKQGAGQDGRP